jgi:hypothetical protein
VVPEQRHEVLDSASSMSTHETSAVVAAYMNQKQVRHSRAMPS